MEYLLINRDTSIELADGENSKFKRFKKQIWITQAHPNCRCQIRYYLVEQALDESLNDAEFDILPTDKREQLFGDITNFKFDEMPILNQSEIASAGLLQRELGEQVYAVPRVNSPDGVSSPDFMTASGKLWEQKHARTKNSINEGVQNAFHKIKDGKVDNLILNLNGSTLSVSEYSSIVFERLRGYPIQNVWITDNEELIEIIGTKK